MAPKLISLLCAKALSCLICCSAQNACQYSVQDVATGSKLKCAAFLPAYATYADLVLISIIHEYADVPVHE